MGNTVDSYLAKSVDSILAVTTGQSRNSVGIIKMSELGTKWADNQQDEYAKVK